MNYTIRNIPGEPRFDVLGVIKLGCDASVDINDRIYAQAQLGRNEDFLYIRILSFEPKPAPNALLSAMFSMNNRTLNLSVGANGVSHAQSEEVDLTKHLTAYGVQGEDLQGEYWGVVMLFPLDQLFLILGTNEAELPLSISGNVSRSNPAVSSAVPLDETVLFKLM